MQSYTYNEDNYLTSYTDVQGAVTNMTYDSEGNVLSVSDLKGKTQYQYNEKNLLTYSREHYGKRKYFTYDEKGYLISERTEGLGEVTYEYENGRMSRITDALGSSTVMKCKRQIRQCI